jgi:hypothetical protein
VTTFNFNAEGGVVYETTVHVIYFETPFPKDNTRIKVFRPLKCPTKGWMTPNLMPSRNRNFLFCTTSKPLWSSCSLLSEGNGGFSPGIKRQVYEADHSPTPNAESYSTWSFTLTPLIRIHAPRQLYSVPLGTCVYVYRVSENSGFRKENRMTEMDE